MDSMFLIAVDAHSKWPEVIKMKSTTSDKTIAVLRTMFSRNGIPSQICTDNGRQFVSEEFQGFVKSNGIKHFTSAPYHPSTNGLAERFVQTFKKALKAMDHDKRSIQHKIDDFLLAYRNAVHATTNQTPAMMFLNRSLRSRMDLLKPDVRRDVENRQFKNVNARTARSFNVGQSVLVRDYRTDKWQPGTISAIKGPLMYRVDVGQDVWRRHVDQILDAQVDNSTPDPCSPTVGVEAPAVCPTASAVTAAAVACGNEPPVPVETLSPNLTSLSPNGVPASPKQMSQGRRFPQRQRQPPRRLDL